MPMNRATLELFVPLDRGAPASARPARGRDLRRDHRRRRTTRHAPARLARARRGARVSRGVVSEAYAQIAAEGWIEIRHGAAPVVRAVPGGSPARGTVPGRCAADPRRRAASGGGRPRSGCDLTRDRAGSVGVPAAGVGGGAAAGARGDAGRGARLRRSARGRGAARASWPRTWCGCAGRRRRGELVVTCGYTQGAVADVPGAGARGARRRWRSRTRRWTTRGRRSARRGWRSSACRWTSTGSARTRCDADAVLVTPAHQFPTGAVLAPERRRALLAWGGIVLEDDYDSEYRYDRAPVGTLQRLAPDRVVYLGTASKTLAPALRLGWAAGAAGPRRGDRARALGGRLRRAGDHGARLRAADRQRRARPPPAPHPPRVPRAPRPAGRGARERLPGAGSTASPPACTCCCGSRRARTRTRWSSAGRAPHPGPRACELPLTRTRGPALVIGYGRLPSAAIDAAVAALREAVISCRRPCSRRPAARTA